ncbi:hypothetical protein [Streptomyces erythrochromogenes]|uniref:hypothetical protein n=1 Tax=Streptomyces erythrochromogenes TaxID=285574 RepID=UPI0037CFF576
MPVIRTKFNTVYDTDRMTEEELKDAIRRLDHTSDFASVEKLERAMAKRGFRW